MTTPFTADTDTGVTVYAVAFRLSDGKVFDWSNNTYQLIGSAVTPAIAMTSQVNYGGSLSQYGGNIDLVALGGALPMVPVDISIKIFKQLGGSPAPVTDTRVGSISPGRLIYGEFTPKSGQDCVVDATANLTTTSGVSMHLTVELKRPDGRTIPLHTIDPTATCAIVVTQDATSTAGARVSQFTLSTTDCGAVNASDRFEIEYPNPALTANRGFTGKATVVSGGITYQGDVKFFS
jgi:hypothetical protein